MAFDFPSSPAVGAQYQGYTWDGEKWVLSGQPNTYPRAPCGRLSLSATDAVMTASVVAVTNVYWLPYLGSAVPFWNGSFWYEKSVGAVVTATTDTVFNPGAVAASSLYDWFLWDNAGTVRLCHGPAWTSNTVRSAGTALVLRDGIQMNNADITNGPAAQRGIYVGTTQSDGNAKMSWIFGGAGAGGVAAGLFVWNMYNRVRVMTGVYETQQYSAGAMGYRPVANSLNNRIFFVSGLPEEAIEFTVQTRMLANPASSGGMIGMMMDGTNSSNFSAYFLGAAVGDQATPHVSVNYQGVVGAHYVQATEAVETGTILFVGGYEMLYGRFMM
jgi:hypothetical protein